MNTQEKIMYICAMLVILTLTVSLAYTYNAYVEAEQGRQELGQALYGLMGAYNSRVPQCAEDVVLVGQGEFENGQWQYYTCGPALDDFGG